MQVQYRQTKSGFECIHAPSIDLTSIQNSTINASRRSTGLNSSHHEGVRRSLTKKVSKLSLMRNKDKEPSVHENTKADNATLSSGTTDMSKSNSSSLNNLSSNAHTIREGQTMTNGNEPTSPTQGGDSPETPTKTKHLPPIPRDFAQQQRATSPAPPSSFKSGTLANAEAEPEAFDAIAANSLAVRFEINIVKVSCSRDFLSPRAFLTPNGGPSSSATRHPIPTRRRRRLAIPDARAAGPHRAQAMTDHSPLSSSHFLGLLHVRPSTTANVTLAGNGLQYIHVYQNTKCGLARSQSFRLQLKSFPFIQPLLLRLSLRFTQPPLMHKCSTSFTFLALSFSLRA